MKALFLNPPAGEDGIRQVREGRCMQRAGAWTAVWSPITLARCAAILRRAGYEVRLADGTVEKDLTFDRLTDLCADFQPDLVFFNAVTPSFLDDLRTPAAVRRAAPAGRAYCFSIRAAVMPEYAFDNSPGLDGIVRGEPEETVAELGEMRRAGVEPTARTRGLSLRDPAT